MYLITNKMIDRIVQSAAKKYNPKRMVDVPETYNNLYFFFRHETELGSPKHHAIPNKNKIFDYIDGVYYDTLDQWAVANGRTLNDIMYGVASQNGTTTWITIESFARSINPNFVWSDAKEESDDNRLKIYADINSNLLVARNYLNHVEYLMKKLY